MKKLFKNLLPLLLLVAGLGISPNLWAISEGSDWGTYAGDVYFDNSKTNWSQVAFFVGRYTNYGSDGKGSYGIDMSPISNTKLYYVRSTDYSQFTTAAFFGVNGWAWEGNTVTDRSLYTYEKYTNSYNTHFKDDAHLYTPASGNKDANLTKTDLSNGYQDLNKTSTVYVYVKYKGQSTDTKVTSNWPGTITPDAYYMSSESGTTHNTTALTPGDGVTVKAALTSKFTLTAVANSGYSWTGWTRSDGYAVANNGNVYTNDPVDKDYSLYAYFEENAYYMKYNWDGSNWSWNLLTDKGDGTYSCEGTFRGGYTMNWHFLSASASDESNRTTATSSYTLNSGDKCIFTLNPTAGTIIITPKSYTLTLNNNGGTITSGQSTQTVTVMYGQSTITGSWEVPTKTGYKCANYFTETNKTNPVILSSSKTFSTAATNPYAKSGKWSEDGDRTVYAKWDANKYNVKFSPNGGSGDQMENQQHTYDQSLALSKNTYTRIGYNFIGWNTDKNATTALYADEAVVSNLTTGTTQVELFAIWSPTTTTITIYKNDQGVAYQDEPTIQMTATYDVAMPATAATGWTRTGYTLNNFYLERGCTNIITSTNTKYASNKTYNEIVYTNSANPPVWKYTANNTLAWYAKWQAKTYTITFNPNGGSSEQYDKTATYDSRTGIANCTKPTHATANFAGYYLNAEGTGDPLYNAEGTLQSNVDGYTNASGNWIHDGDVEVFAKWTSSYVITLNNMDATSAETQNVEVEQGKTTGLTDPISCPEKTGYTFGGYFTAASGGGTKVIDATGSWVIPVDGYIDNEGKWIPANGAEFKAYWIANVTNVTFEKNGGTSGTNSRALTYNSTQNLGTITITKTGYIFGGYFTGDNGTGTQLVDENGAWIANVAGYTSNDNPIKWIKTTTDPLTLYAKWTPITYTITYAGNGNTGGSTESSSHTYDVEQALTANGFTRAYTVFYMYNGATGGNTKTSAVANYTFANWTFNETNYTDEEEVTNLASTQGAEVTMTAQWTPASVTLPTPQKTGYNFTGWYNNSALIGNAGASYIPTADIALTAQWTAKTYTISFDNNGGTGTTPGNVTATYNAAMPTLSNFTAPVKNGYKFLGYYSAETGGTQYYTAAGISARTWNKDANTTLYAQWDQIHVYIEGRFKVRTELDGNTWKYTGATDGAYVSDGSSTKNIEIPFVEAENKYRLNTYLYVNEAAASINSNLYVLHIATWTQSGGFTKLQAANCTGDNFWFNKDNISSGLTSSSGKNFWFSETTNFGGPIILTYDPVANTLSYTAAPEQTYSVNFKSGGHGHLNFSDGVHSVGVRSGYNVTATPDAGYKFEKWTTTGGAQVANADNASTSVTVTGEGSVTANFVEMKKIYYRKPSDWPNNQVFVYFYTTDKLQWNDAEECSTKKGPESKNLTGFEMTRIGQTDIYYYAYDFTAHAAVAFVNDRQDNYSAFDNTYVTALENFNPCYPLFNADNYISAIYNKHDCNTDNYKECKYYGNGYWSSYDEETEYYLRGSFNDWAGPRDEYRFKPTTDPNVFEAVWTSTSANQDIFFKLWQTCDCWLGKTSANYTGDVENISLEYGSGDSYNISYTAPKVGSYQFKYNVSSQKLSITYMGDIMVQDFPEEVSVITGRQYKITPTVTLREGMTLDDLEISVTGNSHAQFTQSGTNLIVLGNSEGTDNVIVTYRNKNTDYSVTKNLKVNVATGITLQAKTETTEQSWTKTDLVHVHFWSTDGDKAQDASMTYNSESGIYSVTIPKIVDGEGNINFLFWYGENINMLGGNDAKWRQTDNMQTKVDMCYTIGYNSASDAYRVATPGTGLCESGAYQIEISMKNGNTYLSNIVTTESTSKTFSFFAPQDGDVTYKGGTVRLLKDGAVVKTLTGFSQAGIYVADLGSDDITTPKLYEGDYYVIAGVSGSELDDNTKMHKFTPRANTAEDYSYYWTVYSGNCTDKNVIAKVANEYNSNLSLTIGADALTQSDGTVAAGNVRFSYEPTTNAFKRAILGASNSNDFLNVYGNNVYADADATQPLNEAQSLNLSKFADNSDWVYEKVVYVKVADAESESKVTLKSVFNGQTSHLLGYEIDDQTGEEKKDSPNQLTVLGKGSTTGESAYAIRISYDFKRNRLISSWEPTAGTYNSDMSINSDVLFIRTEDDDVQQVQVGIKDGGTESYKISSLQHVMFVMEIDGSTDKTSYSQYWISLPFDCQISDIFGVEGYITLDENRIALDGTWGIMRYRGDLRAQKGWFQETEGFWEWMYENETMYAGEGYVLFFERSSIKDWPTIKAKDGSNKALKRLYFPSLYAGFEMTNTVDEAHSKFTCESMRCTIKTPEDREAYDSNWRVIGPKSYNNIKAQSVVEDQPYGEQTKFPNFLYTYNVNNEKGHKYEPHDGKEFNYQSFHSYMVQYEGTITWVPYTQTTPATVAAHYVEDSNFKGGTLTIELMQNNEQLDRTFVKLDEKSTAGFDFSQDMTKITENAAQIASISENVLYAGNTLPLNTELVPLNVKVTANGTYDIALKQSLEGLEVKLFDAFEQTITPLDLMSATITLEKGEYKDRFFLQLKQKGADAPTSFDGKMEQYNLPMDKTQKLLFNGNIYLINAGRVYNATGAELR